jgi:AraC family transcriptional regulator
MLDTSNRTPRRPETREYHSLAVQRVISAIRERLDENISLSEMAAVAYMSRYHFNRTFRQVTGLPPRRFLSKLRVEAATRMLLNTNTSVTDICLDVGYNSLGTFVRRFSGALGISPSKLRLLRRSPSRKLLDHVDDSIEGAPPGRRASVTGGIQAPPSFSGPVFIGLFSTPIPEGTPVACATILHSGDYRMSGVPKGRYYIFALGLPWPDSLDGFFRYENALRGGGQLVTVNHEAVECDEINLRAAAATDPPVLLNLPFLLGKKRELRKVS